MLIRAFPATPVVAISFRALFFICNGKATVLPNVFWLVL